MTSSTTPAQQPSTKRPANAELYQHIPTAKIIELFNRGLSHRKIGKVLRMGPGSVGTRLRREGKVRTLKVRCQFQGGAGLKEKYRPANPCLGEFEVTPLHAPRSKYCRNCAPVAKKWLSAWNANARYKAEAEKYAKITRVNRWKRRKAAGRPCRRFGSTQPCQYRDHGKRGEGCLVTFKLKSSFQKYCEPCQKRVDAKRSRDYRENNKIEVRRKDSERRKRRTELQQAELAEAKRILAQRGAAAQHEDTKSRITLAAYLSLANWNQYAMKEELYPKQHRQGAAYAASRQFFKRYATAIESEKLRLSALSENERVKVAEKSRTDLGHQQKLVFSTGRSV